LTRYLNSTTLSGGQTYDYMFWWVSGEDSQSNPVAGTPIAATRARMLVNPTLSASATDVGHLMLPGSTHNTLVSVTYSAEMVGAVITLSGLDFTKTSSSSATSSDISKFQLWHDVNNNGSWDSGVDTQLGLDQIGTVNPSFSGLSFATTYGTSEMLLLTVDISSGAVMSHDLGMEITQSSDTHLTLSADDVSGTFPMPTGASDHSLPVSFSSFTIVASNGNNQLNWTTETEQNNAGFAVWRAVGTDLEVLPSFSHFTQLARYEQYTELAGSGNSAQPNDYSFIDEQVDPGTIYFYLLEAIDLDGSSEFYTQWVAVESLSIPETWDLVQNYPNPFNPSTTIQFALPEPATITLQIYNMKGELVQTLFERELYSWGRYQVIWDGRNHYGTPVASGVYFYRLLGEDFIKTRKMTLVR
nr:T9SS type A sorting domain-containing protein [bacterium]